MPKKIAKGFTILELLVVLAVLGVFAVVAYPNITKWITDREVRSETYKFIGEINEMKSKVTSGEYALAMVRFGGPNSHTYASIEKRYMTRDDFAKNYPISNMSSGANQYWSCDYDIRNQKYTYDSDYLFESQQVRHWPNIHMCISKDGTKKGVLNQKNPDTGQRRTLGRVIICSVQSTTPCKGGNCSNRCNDTNKNDFRYMVTWDVFANLKIYKFNMKKNQWCSGKICRSMSEFN